VEDKPGLGSAQDGACRDYIPELAIRVRLFLYTVFTQVITGFSDFHCY
jgi:hypothetical protein